MRKLILVCVLLNLALYSNSQDAIIKNDYSAYIDSVAKINPTFALYLKSYITNGCEKTVKTENLNPDSLIQEARTYLGVPHCMGGTSRKCVDCSGLVYVVCKKFGAELPRGSQNVGKYGRLILYKDSLQKGDIVFFTKTYRTSKFLTHAGFYIGDGVMIHASSGAGVIETNIWNSKYWNSKYVFATRLSETN